MALHSEDREELLVEATALVERAELALASGEHIVIGFRANGAGSFYVGSEPAYHFNSADELRRAYVREELFKAERGRLVALVRRRTAGEVQLIRRELNGEETDVFTQELAGHVAHLTRAIDDGQFAIIGQVPADADVVGRARRWLGRLAGSIVIAHSARVA
ncbi:MAG: hypothetical protein WD176_08060 [Pirellulales bacterium]